MIFVGEVHTSLLRHPIAVDTPTAVSLLELKAGAPVRHGERPARFAQSPSILTGVDCPLTSAPQVRGVGTASSHTVLAGGQVLLCSSSVHIVQSTARRRLPWSHYLSRPGTVEAINRAETSRLLDGFMRTPHEPATMDLAALNDHLHTRIQTSRLLTGPVPFRTSPLRLRWAALPGHAKPELTFSVGRDGVRSLVLRLPEVRREAVIALCEDIALHDWLLTSVQRLLDQSRIGSATPPEVAGRLAPAVTFLFHLWMPGARLDAELLPAWKGLEKQSGFSRQWRVSKNRIRDQLLLAAARPAT